ncbi:1-phosphofructokinase [Actinotalea lenta]|uniref:1-phosphofructokinase n=1 Tax=Actinotalea lenta TaxID=3064654 RepID=UPI00272D7E0E|nr:1-phosphofructokinase [Isoptericola sp. b490]
MLAITLNPSLDRTVEVPRLRIGEVNRATGGHLHPGGKGVNVTRALLANGVAARAVLPVGGSVGSQVVDLLGAEGVDAITVAITGQTRSNVTIAEADGTVTKINEPGPALADHELDAVVEAALGATRPGAWVVLCGSLPAGAPADTYARMVPRFVERGARVAVDTSGPALVEALAACPALVKPNAEELAEAVGRRLRNRSDVVEAARELRSAGVGAVLVSLGPAGAVLVDADGVLVGTSVAIAPRSTVGAGDAFLAGFLSAHDGGRRAAMAAALAWGAAAVQLPGTQMPGPSDVDPAAAVVLPDNETDAFLPQPLVGTA